jgi:RNA polymerase sigma factor (sigma-70 family)
VVTDAELMGAWQAGDRAAGGILFERYFEPVRRFFHNKVADGVEDLVQQTFLACVDHRDSIREPGAFRGYLFAAARNRLYKHIRSRARSPIALDFGVSSVIDAGVSPSQVVAGRDDERVLLQALRSLPIDLQVALELYYFERVRGRELEIALDVPAGTVRSRLRRGLELVRQRVGELSSAPEVLGKIRISLDEWSDQLGEDQRTENEAP